MLQEEKIFGGAKWKLSLKYPTKQDANDGVNCGVYVCKYFELLINRREPSLSFNNDKDSLKKFRNEIYMDLLASSDCSASYCVEKLNTI